MSLTVIELIELAKVSDFDPAELIRKLARSCQQRREPSYCRGLICHLSGAHRAVARWQRFPLEGEKSLQRTGFRLEHEASTIKTLEQFIYPSVQLDLPSLLSIVLWAPGPDSLRRQAVRPYVGQARESS
jgi:hypothetical protein